MFDRAPGSEGCTRCASMSPRWAAPRKVGQTTLCSVTNTGASQGLLMRACAIHAALLACRHRTLLLGPALALFIALGAG